MWGDIFVFKMPNTEGGGYQIRKKLYVKKILIYVVLSILLKEF